MIDLHTHSSASDGKLSPAQLVRYAAEKGVTLLALTDHDTTAGLDEAADEAQKIGLGFIRGIEITIEWKNGEFHLLGLGLQRITDEMAALTRFLQDERSKRNYRIFELLCQGFFPAMTARELETDIATVSHTSSVGRPHIADYLVAHGIVKKRQEAFDKYLGNGKNYYAKHVGALLESAICAVRSCGAIPVIAHPMSLYISWGAIEGVFASLQEKGIAGLECYHPGASETECKRLVQTAQKQGLYVTAGSDFHDENSQIGRKIGYSGDGRKIEAEALFCPPLFYGLTELQC
ncbi:MAG: PHP domain-containing protein [Treponemataceae bacterium]|nr:MAG: PHP domain-containing protein [Treponemataceae bacterium]